MAWETMWEWKERARCACGRGFVIRSCYTEGDDWNRYRDGISDVQIDCECCAAKYHPEDSLDGTYLVPNGETLRINTREEDALALNESRRKRNRIKKVSYKLRFRKPK